MSFYAQTHECGPRAWWMSKEHDGPRHGHHEEHGRGPRGFGPGGPFGREFGPGGPGFGPRGPMGRGGGPYGRGGRKRRGDVRLALLMLLSEEPRNGYQLMQTIEEKSGGRWRPSPGSVYPALSQLEDEGLVRANAQDSGRTFEITDAGRAHLQERSGEPAPWDTSDGGPGVQKLHELRTLIPGIAQAVWQVAQVGDESQWTKATEILDEARRALYRLLADAPAGNEPTDAAPTDDQPVE